MSDFVNKVLLFPYYVVLKTRNHLYRTGKKQRFSFDVPVICIGNVTVGGTGKTPHTEMFIRHYLEQGKKVAVVSRGYGRKTKESILVENHSTYNEVGDEPLQIKHKFPEITVVVDKDRRHAIDLLMAGEFCSVPDIIILDDAFQHLRIKPSRNIVLINYQKPVFKDSLLPYGTLRDLPERIGDADTVIITKCPPFLNKWEQEKCIRLNRISPLQKVFFTTVNYLSPLAVFPHEGNNRFIYSQEVIVVTGIANGKHLKNYLLTKYKTVLFIEFGDHHRYSRNDIRRIDNLAEKHPRAVLLTTEKDAQRFMSDGNISERMKERLFYVPIQVELIDRESPEGLF